MLEYEPRKLTSVGFSLLCTVSQALRTHVPIQKPHGKKVAAPRSRPFQHTNWSVCCRSEQQTWEEWPLGPTRTEAPWDKRWHLSSSIPQVPGLDGTAPGSKGRVNKRMAQSLPS